MITRKISAVPPAVQNWRELYTYALLEKDKQELPSRIDKAEKALIMRGRELFEVSDKIRADEEAQAVDEALYFLRALRTCLNLRTVEPKAV